MKIQYVSDLHLEFGYRAIIQPAADILVLAGDISSDFDYDFFYDVSRDFKHVLYVAGNHEFYGHTGLDHQHYINGCGKFKNVHYLDKEKIEIDGITFFGATLWSDLSRLIDALISKQMLNDYSWIKGWTPELATAEFKSTVIPKVDVVITHYAPSYMSVAEEYKGNVLNASYASNLESTILDLEPKYWIHGHMHTPVDYMIGNTRVVSNPRGYEGSTPCTCLLDI